MEKTWQIREAELRKEVLAEIAKLHEAKPFRAPDGDTDFLCDQCRGAEYPCKTMQIIERVLSQ